MLLGTFKISFETFLIFSLLILDPLFQITFTHKVQTLNSSELIF